MRHPPLQPLKGVTQMRVRTHSLSIMVGICILSGMYLMAPAQDTLYPLKVSDSAIENPYVLHAVNWPPRLGLPDAAIMRTNAGERWNSIEIARGVFSPTFGNLFTPDTGWVAMAEKYRTELVYTFSTVPVWATGTPGSGPSKVAPSDVDEHNETCKAPLAGVVSRDGNCIWKEWITALMQKNCETTTAPSRPLIGRCHIHFFEAWNEFNAGLFWDDSIEHLAKLSNDMALIVRAYCGDCKVIGGSTSAGGVGRMGDGRGGSGQFDVALGEFLDAWHRIPGASLPDVVSFHAYPSRTNVSPVPFPETAISEGDNKCTPASVPNVWCQYAIVDQPARVRLMLSTRAFLPASTPIWNTESGWMNNRNLFHGRNEEGYADVETGILRQAFLAREAILLANLGVAVNLWYEADHPCTGTLAGFGSPQDSVAMRSCFGDPIIPHGLTPAGQALVAVHNWLHGATFDGPCKPRGTAWTCPLTEADKSRGVIGWTTNVNKRESILPSTRFKYAHSLDGATQSLDSDSPWRLEARPIRFDNSK
jgi:hypothetical protein